jgi:hypothetical protein
VLSEQYYSNGFPSEYAPHIKLNHFYIGRLSELNEFTRDFIAGEIRYFSESASERRLIEPSWLVRGNFNREGARYLVKTLYRYAAGHWPTAQGPSTASTLYQIAKYLPAAAGNTRFPRVAPLFKRLWCSHQA